MCLSTVVSVRDGKSETLCSKIQTVLKDPSADKFLFTDILGREYSVEGKIVKIDLLDNVIEVETA